MTVIGYLKGLEMNTSVWFTMIDWMMLYPLFSMPLGTMSLSDWKQSPQDCPYLSCQLQVWWYPRATLTSDLLATDLWVPKSNLRFDYYYKDSEPTESAIGMVTGVVFFFCLFGVFVEKDTN